MFDIVVRSGGECDNESESYADGCKSLRQEENVHT
jgi:hypothetical protein